MEDTMEGTGNDTNDEGGKGLAAEGLDDKEVGEVNGLPSSELSNTTPSTSKQKLLSNNLLRPSKAPRPNIETTGPPRYTSPDRGPAHDIDFIHLSTLPEGFSHDTCIHGGREN